MSTVVIVDYHGVLASLGRSATSVPPNITLVTAEALWFLQQMRPYQVHCLSNQRGVADGLFTERALQCAIDRLCDDLRCRGIALAGFHYCPHHPEGTVASYRESCACRKPGTAKIDHILRLTSATVGECILVGDTLATDIACARAAGIASILLGRESSREDLDLRPDWCVDTLAEAATTVHHFAAHRVSSRRG